MTDLPTSVDIRGVGPRDGLQIETPISTDAKIRLVRALVTTGVRQVEATAFVSPRAVPALADAEQVAEFVQSIPDVEWSGLVASPNGARRAIGTGLRTIEYVVSAADGHSRANARRSTREASTRSPRSPRSCTTPAAARGDHRDRVGLPVRRDADSASVRAISRRSLERCSSWPIRRPSNGVLRSVRHALPARAPRGGG
jgi:hypothetical protein